MVREAPKPSTARHRIVVLSETNDEKHPNLQHPTLPLLVIYILQLHNAQPTHECGIREAAMLNMRTHS